MTTSRKLTGWSLILASLAGFLVFVVVTAPERPVAAQASTGPAARLTVAVVDEATGRPTSARARLTNANGQPMPPPDAAVAVMYGREPHRGAEGYAAQADGSFYVDGSFTIELPEGAYRLETSKGYEFLSQEHRLDLEAGQRLDRECRLERWIDMPSRG